MNSSIHYSTGNKVYLFQKYTPNLLKMELFKQGLQSFTSQVLNLAKPVNKFFVWQTYRQKSNGCTSFHHRQSIFISSIRKG